MMKVFASSFSQAACARFRSHLLTDVKSHSAERCAPAHVAHRNVATALASWLILTTLLRAGAPALEPLEPLGGIQLAAEWQREERSGDDFESDDAPPPGAHRTLMPGQKPGRSVTAPPNGYDAKHLNRVWGRFRGAKGNPKAEKQHK